MIVVMGQGCTDEQIERVQQAIESKPGYKAPVWRGEERSVVGVIGSIYPELQSELELLPGVRAGAAGLETVQAGRTGVPSRRHRASPWEA